MAKAIRVNIRTPRELTLLKGLANGHFTFEELTEEEKYIVYTSDFDLTGHVDPDVMMEYERKLSMQPFVTGGSIAEELTTRFINVIRERLPQ